MNEAPQRRVNRTLTWLAAMIAAVMVVAIPAGYFYTAVDYERARIDHDAALGADRLSEYVYTRPATWRFEEARLEGILARVRTREGTIRQHLVDTDGTILLAQGPGIDGPLLVGRAEVTDGEKVVAIFEVRESLAPVIYRTAVVVLLAFLLSLWVFAVLRGLPMRTLSQALRQLEASRGALQREVEAKELALKKAHDLGEAMRQLSLHDQLTGLPNRSLFLDRLEQAVLSAKRDKAPLAVLVLDLDRFKEVNDSLGHQMGDRLLQEVARRIRKGMRKSDTVARLGGDEFGVILPHTGAAAAKRVAQDLFDRLKIPVVEQDGHRLSVGASCGIAMISEDVDEPTLLLQGADVAMYQAKRAKQNVAVYDARNDPNGPLRLKLLADLHLAMERNELVLWYQPKVRMVSGAVQGVEALLRWQHPQEGLILPQQFIPLAEEAGFISSLSHWVIDRALEAAARWANHERIPTIAVNVSATDLLSSELPDRVAQRLRQWGLAPHVLELEITESAMFADPPRALETLSTLHDMGIRLAVDDFGTGYSSLSYLKQLPVESLKIDRGFVANLARQSDDLAIVRSTINLAHDLGMYVVAEGIADRETWTMVRKMGCDVAQGDYISEPVPEDRLLDWVAGWRWGDTRLRGLT